MMGAAPGETARALYGAYRLASLDSAGMDYFKNTRGAFWRSFNAALIIAPFYAGLLLMRYQMGEVSASPLSFISIEAISYIISWVAFPVVVDLLITAMGRRERYIRFIIAYNWASVLQNLIYLPMAMLSVNGILSSGNAGILGLTILVLFMVYTWFITKTALDIPGGRAATIVAIDFALSLLINGHAEKLVNS
jgi:hypothetical protein